MQPEYIKIPLTKGYEAIVDAEDADRVLAFKWHARIKGQRADGSFIVYACRSTKVKQKPVRFYLHRILAGAKEGEEVDHENRDTLDNRKANLRFATRSQNLANTTRPLNASGYRGVYWHRKGKKWMACIRKDRRNHYLGLFTDIEEAARAYDAAALVYHGEFAMLNFPTNLN